MISSPDAGVCSQTSSAKAKAERAAAAAEKAAAKAEESARKAAERAAKAESQERAGSKNRRATRESAPPETPAAGAGRIPSPRTPPGAERQG